MTRRAGWIVLVIAVLGLARPAGAASMRWYNSFEEAGPEARRDNRPLLVEFWADWCLPCKVMEAEVYSRDDVAQAARRFLPVRINFDQKTTLARKYNITAMPTILVTDSYGHEIFRYSGFIAAVPFMDLLRSLPQDVGEFNRLNQVLDRDKNNFAALDGMGSSLKAAGLYLASNEYYLRALQRNEAKSDPAKREMMLTAMGSNYLAVKDGRQAVEVFEKCVKGFPESPRMAEWTLGLGRAYLIDEKKDKARTYLEGVLKRYPGTPESEQAKALLGPR